MYSARTLLVPVFLMGGLMEVASAQHKYIFPQFAFGGGWESTLMVQALGSNTTCTFSAQDRSFTMRDPYGNNLSGTQQQQILGMNGWTILKTATPQGMAASSGMAVLDCDEEVSANTLFSLEVGGSLVAEALVESSEEIVSGEPAAQFLADHRDGARFAVAVANPSNQPLDVLIAVGDLGGQQIGEVTVNVPANAAQAFFVDELVTIPTGHTGQVLIRPSNNPGPSVYVVGLRVTGLVITTIPAIVYPRPTTSPPNDLFSNAQTISGPSGRVTGSNVGATDETGEPGFGISSSSVWWQWQATSSGRVTIDTIGSSFDTTLGVYTGTRVDTLTTLGENDDGLELFGASRVTLTVTAGTVYRLRVAGFFGDEGSIVLNWNPDTGLSDTPRTTFGPGTWLVNEEIAPGRYFTNPSRGCYWERLSGVGGSTADILANEFISFDSGQEIVDIARSDYAFKSDAECGTWRQTPVSAPSSGIIPPGRWLVGRQIPAGNYEINAGSGCYWERLSGFSGNLNDIIANDFIAASGRQIVRISSSDEGFYSDADCGTWSRRTGSALTTSAAGSGFSEGVISPATDRGTINRNRQMYRAKSGLR